jgi:hypothetical protein
MHSDDELEMVREHVRRGKGHIENQLRIIGHLQLLGSDTTLAEHILANLLESQARDLVHLKRLQAT